MMLLKPVLPRSKRAFTSVEFVGAAALSLILATIALTGYRLYERESPVKSVARRLTQALSTARAFAISGNSPYTLTIDLKYRNFWIDQTNESGTVTVPKVTSPERIDDRVAIDRIMIGGAPVLGTVAK